MKNNTLAEIAARLLSAERILLFPHVRADGDALGSAVSLCAALREKRRQAYVLLEDEIAENLRFLMGDYCTTDCSAVGKPDVCVSVDCSDVDRFEKRRDVFFSADCKICIDHHVTTGSFGDMNYIDPEAAATGELIYELLVQMSAEITPFMADALYAAIETDTGGFRYSNTTRRSHLITAALFDSGLDSCRVCNEIYDSMRREQLTLHAEALSGMRTFAGGQANLACVTREMLQNTGADMSESEGIVEKLRSIRGIEISVLLKEEDENVIKVSMRAKSRGDVAVISQKFEGGGHKKAAGCTIRLPMEEACRQIIDAVEEELEKECSQCAKE